MISVKQPEPLPENLIEREEVMKTLIYQSNGRGITEIALLELSPGAKIKRHKHTDDNEIYFDIITKEVEVCEIGGEHELENFTKDVLYVLSIKWR